MDKTRDRNYGEREKEQSKKKATVCTAIAQNSKGVGGSRNSERRDGGCNGNEASNNGPISFAFRTLGGGGVTSTAPERERDGSIIG